MRADVRTVLEAYPRIYFACHRRHVQDPEDGSLLSAHRASVLDHLDAVEAMSLNDLAGHMGVTPSTMSLTIDKLERDGYVVRERDSADRRRLQLRLSDNGVRIRGANSVLDPDLVADMLDELPAAERRAALDGLITLGRAADAARRKLATGARASAG